MDAPDPLQRRRDVGTCLGVALVALGVYWVTACRTVFVGDSGELAAVCATFGIAHPSGYPLYTLLGGAFTHCWPFGSPVLAANLFSGACAATAVGFCAAVVGDWVEPGPGRRPAMVGAAAMLAFATAFWQEATVSRVYALNAACSLALLWCAGRWVVRGTTGWAVATGAVAGAAMAHHLAAVGAVVAAAVLVVGGRWHEGVGRTWQRERWRIAWATGAFALGLALYVWLPWRYTALPEVRWGPITTLAEWKDYVLRTQFADRSWTQGSPLRIAQALGHGLWVVAWDLKGLGALAAGIGIYAWRQQRVRWGALLAGALVFGLLFVQHGQRRDVFLWDRYWIWWHCLAALLAGGGLAWLGARMRLSWQRWALATLLPAILLAWHWGRCDRSDHTLARDFAEKLLERIPPKAQVVVEGDDNVAFPLLYFIAAEGRRPDLARLWHGMRPGGKFTFNGQSVASRTALWTHAPDLPAGYAEVTDDSWGLVSLARRHDMPPPPPTDWAEWSIPSFEAAPPPDAVYESHERELLSHYFNQKARALDATDPTGADHALVLALAYAAGNEGALIQVHRAARRLGRTVVANTCYERIAALNRRSLDDLRGE